MLPDGEVLFRLRHLGHATHGGPGRGPGLSTVAYFPDWLTSNKLADNWSDVAGVALSIVGFTATIVGVLRTRRAANRAREVAEQTRDSIRLLDTIVDFS